MSSADVGDAKLLTKEEAAKAKAEIAEGNEDEFEDAVEGEEGADASGNFRVTPEELAIIRAELACEFPEDYTYLSDAYVLSVASKGAHSHFNFVQIMMIGGEWW